MASRRLVAGAAVALVVAAGALSSPSWALARATWLAADPWRLGATLCVLAVVRPFLAWPMTLLALLAGYGYGLPGFVVALALVPVSSLPPFVFGKRLGGAGRVADAGRRFVGATGTYRGVTASRLLPLPSDPVSVAIGVAGVPLRPFLVGTTVGEIPWIAAGVVAGASAERLLTEGVGGVFDPALVVATALAGLVLLAGPLYRRRVAA